MGDLDRIRRKKLLYRAWHRGTREADLLLGTFADRHLAGFDTGQLDEFEALLENDDAVIYDWFAGRGLPPVERRGDVMNRLLGFRYAARP
jgi:antitoxin CptB